MLVSVCFVYAYALVYVHVTVNACLDLYAYMCTYTYDWVSVYVCTCTVCVHTQVYVCVCLCVRTCISYRFVCTCMCMHCLWVYYYLMPCLHMFPSQLQLTKRLPFLLKSPLLPLPICFLVSPCFPMLSVRDQSLTTYQQFRRFVQIPTRAYFQILQLTIISDIFQLHKIPHSSYHSRTINLTQL